MFNLSTDSPLSLRISIDISDCRRCYTREGLCVSVVSVSQVSRKRVTGRYHWLLLRWYQKFFSLSLILFLRSVSLSRMCVWRKNLTYPSRNLHMLFSRSWHRSSSVSILVIAHKLRAWWCDLWIYDSVWSSCATKLALHQIAFVVYLFDSWWI